MSWITKGKAYAKHMDIYLDGQVVLKIITGEAAFVLNGPDGYYSHVIMMLPIDSISLEAMLEDFYKFD